MEAKELRIGNYVHFFHPDRNLRAPYNQLIQVTIEGIDQIQGGHERFMPIPITAEWLERFGFVCEVKGGYQYWKRANEAGEFLDWLSFRRSEISAWGILGREMEDHFQSYLAKDVRIFYVHQLQNLYYCLVGEELYINKQLWNHGK